jgi:hypothetical protein
MKKQILSEELLRMKRLAGIINESQYKITLNEHWDQEDDVQATPFNLAIDKIIGIKSSQAYNPMWSERNTQNELDKISKLEINFTPSELKIYDKFKKSIEDTDIKAFEEFKLPPASKLNWNIPEILDLYITDKYESDYGDVDYEEKFGDFEDNDEY